MWLALDAASGNNTVTGNWIKKNVPNGGKILEVRGLPGNSVDRDRHLGIRSVLEAEGGPKYEIIEVDGSCHVRLLKLAGEA